MIKMVNLLSDGGKKIVENILAIFCNLLQEGLVNHTEFALLSMINQASSNVPLI